METKMYKLVDDLCYGQKYEEIEQCEKCWVKQPCSVAFKNRK
jgi:hypothetical protein